MMMMMCLGSDCVYELFISYIVTVWSTNQSSFYLVSLSAVVMTTILPLLRRRRRRCRLLVHLQKD